MNKQIIEIDKNTVKIDGRVYKAEEYREVWIPEFSGRYWVVTSYGTPEYSIWTNTQVDDFRLDTGNLFRTEEEAIKRAEELNAYARVNKEIREKGYRIENVDWDENYWFISISKKTKKPDSFKEIAGKSKPLFGELKDKESCEALIKSHCDDIKLAFGIYD